LPGVDRDLLDAVVARREQLVASPNGGPVAGWRALVSLVVPGVVPPGDVARCAAVLDDALGRPSQRLVAYGTLRPGLPNHRLLAGRGSWEPVTVRGRLGDWEGYPVLRPSPGDGPDVPAMLLTSAQLPRLVVALDEFEGPTYRRAWVVAELRARAGRRRALIGQCYIDARSG
jgi:gamma-glutamylcyclotransferase (GGCT)/AIG2-like uncharacterized protein YtfP